MSQSYHYDLPESFIAKYPLEKRSDSRLLVYEQGKIANKKFFQLPDILDENSLLVFNNTKVVPARLFFQKPTGAIIQIFLLEPVDYSMTEAMTKKEKLSFKCLVGNLKKWKEEFIYRRLKIQGEEIELKAERTSQNDDQLILTFTWDFKYSFGEILHAIGKIPIPPYLKRETEAIDQTRYQTLLAKYDGSVAAPTASLHFDVLVMELLRKKNISLNEITLHVGAGTFKPLSSGRIDNHLMHAESFEVDISFLHSLRDHLQSAGGKIIPVGTTSMRTLESLYLLGCMELNEHLQENIHVPQFYWKENRTEYNPIEALNALIIKSEESGISKIEGKTSLMIAPGFRFSLSQGLITNFHQPNSSLLVLVHSFIGENWKRVYKHALEEKYRFLSYGDSSLLLP